jgi:large subunit ribosomal protein L15
MEKSGQVKKEGGAYVIDLAKLGYSKLLGTGKLESKLKIVSGKCSKQAAEKVKAAGGSVEAGVSSESD